MMRGKDQRPAAFSPMRESVAAAVQEEVWEVRPSGMLVQKRTPDSDPPPGGAPVPTIRVKVKYAGVYHEVYINSQASFGELKKLMSEKTGLHPDDQKVVYKDRERDSKAFLDMVGVKDRSKMTLLEDPTAQAKRLIEERRNAKAQRAAKAISRVSLDVDKLASKVSALETIVSKGGIQEKRVQKNVETLDAIRAKMTKKNSTPAATANKARAPHLPPRPPPAQQHQQRRQFQPAAPTTATAPAPQTATASWDTFDLLSSTPSSSSPAPVSTMALVTTTSPSPRFEWELF
ncbi:unnamed protein product [Triticum turgidum subsp. durum]|uniref:Ubiquitin-like domain-containing protein n=1 Tax=Triticum turgidum subsp. durum TaxID=4567 RepID=A0A9R0ZB38_TRITD|nr:unnamed protein product [Triticum turgidum subsp. durum]